MRPKQIAIIAVLMLAAVAWFHFDIGSYLQLDVLRERLGELRGWYADNPALTGAIYFLVYVAVAGLSLALRRGIARLLGKRCCR